MSEFVVYHVASTIEKKAYASAALAIKKAERLNNETNAEAGTVYFAVASRSFYENHVVHMVERVNLMSGKKYLEKSNTPYYCSPSSETYWSA